MLDGTIPSDLLSTREDDERVAFPDDMRDDLITTDFQVDIDVLTPPVQALAEALNMNAPAENQERPVEQRWIEMPDEIEQENGKSSMK